MLAALLLFMATPAPAAPVEHRLSEAEIEKILDAAARKREAQALAARKTGPEIHGEIGFSIGSGGYRSAFGTAVVELPDDGFASFTFETSDFGRHNSRAFRRER